MTPPDGECQAVSREAPGYPLVTSRSWERRTSAAVARQAASARRTAAGNSIVAKYRAGNR
jgi:hypothetical protein